MLVINRGQNNTLVCTLKEKQTLTNPYWLFEFTKRADRLTQKIFIAEDLSAYPDSYNKFLITETNGGSENLTSGTISLDAGEWHYRIFEQSSSSSLVVANATTECENGIVMVIESQTTPYTHQISDTAYTYNPT